MSNRRPMGQHEKLNFDFYLQQGYHPEDIVQMPLVKEARWKDDQEYKQQLAGATKDQFKFFDNDGKLLTAWPNKDREMEARLDPLYKTNAAYRDKVNELTINSTYRDNLIGEGKLDEALNGGPDGLMRGARRDALMAMEKQQVEKASSDPVYRFNLMQKLSDPNSDESKLAAELDTLKRGHRPLEDELKRRGPQSIQFSTAEAQELGMQLENQKRTAPTGDADANPYGLPPIQR